MNEGKTGVRHSDELAKMRERIAALEDEVAQHRRAQETLRRQYERLRQCFDLAGGLMIVLDRNGNVSQLNCAAEVILGYGRGELLGKNWIETCVPQRTREEVVRAFQGMIAGRLSEAEYYDNPVITRSGEERIVTWHNALLTDEDGRVVGTLSSGMDVTDRRRAEEALLAARADLEEQVRERTNDLAVFQRYADSSTQGFAMANLAGYITYVNPALCRLFEEERPEGAIGKHISRYYAEGFAGRRQREMFSAFQQKGWWQGEETLRSRRGREIPILQYTFLIRDEKEHPVRLASWITDISERKKAEDELRHVHDELQAIYEGMADGLLIVDIETQRYVQANASICRMLEYTAEELLSMSLSDVHPAESIPGIVARIEALSERCAYQSDDVPLRRRDGSVLFANATVNFLVHGGRRCAAGFFRDNTERKRAQEALQREHRALRRLLQSSDHERQLIAYEIHDELAQLLAGAILQFQAFESLRESDPREAATAYEAARAMLQRSHAEARRLISGVRPMILDEAGVVPAVAHLVEQQRRQAGMEIEYVDRVAFDRLAPILENAIYRICQEALSNACRHSKSDKVCLELAQNGNRVEIEVRDQGVGFDPEAVPDSRYGIAGMRERARLLGGTFSIQSGPGKGARVRVELSLVSEDQGGTAPTTLSGPSWIRKAEETPPLSPHA